MPRAEREILIDAPIEHVFDVIADYERYTEFLPETRDVRLLSRHDGIAVVRFELQLIMRIVYTLRIVEEARQGVRWSLADGRLMTQNDGAWALEQVTPRQTRAKYSLSITLAGMIPKSVSDRLLGETLSQTLSRFKARAEQLRGVSEAL